MLSRCHNSVPCPILTSTQTRYAKKLACGVSCKARELTSLVQMSVLWRNRDHIKDLYFDLLIQRTYQLIIVLLQIQDVLPGDIYLKKHLSCSYFYTASNSYPRLDTYNAEVENSNTSKIVCVYCSCSNDIENVIEVGFPALYCYWCSGIL